MVGEGEGGSRIGLKKQGKDSRTELFRKGRKQRKRSFRWKGRTAGGGNAGAGPKQAAGLILIGGQVV